MEEQPHRGPGLIGSAVLAIEAVRQDQALQLVRLKSLIEKVAECSGQEAHESCNLFALYAAKLFVQSPRLRKFFRALRVQVGRGFEKERLQISGELLELIFSIKEGVDVVRCNARQFGAHFIFIRPPADHIAVIECGLHARVASDHLEAVGAKLEVLDDRRPQHAGDVRRRRNPAARCELGVDFLGDGTAANDITTFEHQDFSAGLRKVGSGC